MLAVRLLLLLTLQQGCVVCKSSYYYSRYIALWHDAKADCEHIGGFLAMFDNEAEMTSVAANRDNWVTDEINSYVGLTDIDTEGSFRWLDGTPLGFSTMWHPGQPNNLGDQDCGFISLLNLLADGNCNSEAMTFICEVQEETQEAQLRRDIRSCWIENDLLRNVKETDSESDVKCPRDKLYFSPSHWNNSKTWDAANAFCKRAGASLAKITSLDEQLMVDRLRLVKKLGNTWFGGTDVVAEGQYTWEDGVPFEWPTFLDAAAPAADSTKNCVMMTGMKTWEAAPCTGTLPLLCEIDMDLRPHDQTCYWRSGVVQTWPENLLTCQAGGGTLANIKSIRHHERMRKLILSDTDQFLVGMNDFNITWDFTWTDGSAMMWALWIADRPNHVDGYQPYGFQRVYKYDDLWPDSPLVGMCEKKAPKFFNAEILHSENRIAVDCQEGCLFPDGTTSRSWTCGEVDVIHEAERCKCPGGWEISEPWLSHLNSSLLKDGDNETCLSMGVTQHIMTLFHLRTLSGNFDTEVILDTDTERHRHDMIRVFTSTDLSMPSATCQLSGPLLKCKHVAGTRYSCKCAAPCRVYVKVFQLGGTVRPPALCELQVIKFGIIL